MRPLPCRPQSVHHGGPVTGSRWIRCDDLDLRKRLGKTRHQVTIQRAQWGPVAQSDSRVEGVVGPDAGLSRDVRSDREERVIQLDTPKPRPLDQRVRGVDDRRWLSPTGECRDHFDPKDGWHEILSVGRPGTVQAKCAGMIALEGRHRRDED